MMLREAKWLAWIIAPEEMEAATITLGVIAVAGIVVSEIAWRLAKYLIRP